MLKKCVIFITIALITALVSCGEQPKSRDAKSPAPSAKKSKLETENDEYIAEESAKDMASEPSSGSSKELPFVFLSPAKFAGERQLEYQVSLAYETRNFELSRKDLLDIVSKFGFLGYTTSGYENLRYSMTAQISVKVGDLYNVVKIMDRLGNLRSENISVVDHTRDLVWNQRVVKRQKGRADRIGRALAQVSPKNKNWREREEALERSEDQIDKAEQGVWDIGDKVAWATITVSIDGLRDVEPIQIPTFRNALVMIVNGIFKALFVLIILLPFAAIAALLRWQWKNIKLIFIRKK